MRRSVHLWRTAIEYFVPNPMEILKWNSHTTATDVHTWIGYNEQILNSRGNSILPQPGHLESWSRSAKGTVAGMKTTSSIVTQQVGGHRRNLCPKASLINATFVPSKKYAFPSLLKFFFNCRNSAYGYPTL